MADIYSEHVSADDIIINHDGWLTRNYRLSYHAQKIPSNVGTPSETDGEAC